jgi:hypothetical protein
MIEQLAGVLLAATLHQPTTTTTVATPYWLRVSRKYQDNRYEKFRRCVVKRESEGIPTVVNRHSGSAGLYQFMPFWQPILVRRLHIPQYRYTNIRHMPANIQTAGFWLVLDHGLGARNWAGGRYDCTHLLP